MMKNTRTLPSIHIPVQNANGSVGWAWYMFFQWVSENVGSVDLSDYFTKEETEELLSVKANIDDLSDVAFSGDYDDLSNKPTIPDAQIQSDWNQADNTKADYIKNKPTVPTVGNGTITITQGGVTKGTFTTNQSGNTTIEIDAGGGSIDAIDNLTITKNTDDEIQAVATVNQNTATGATNPIYDWVGTLAEYTAQNIATLHPDWICFITDDVGGGVNVYTKSEVDSLLAQKVSKGHEVIEFQAPTAANNYTWFRKYADGWVEQGGRITKPNSSAVNVSLPISMSNTEYDVMITDAFSGNMATVPAYNIISNTSFAIYQGNGSAITCHWQVSGMAS